MFSYLYVFFLFCCILPCSVVVLGWCKEEQTVECTKKDTFLWFAAKGTNHFILSSLRTDMVDNEVKCRRLVPFTMPVLDAEYDLPRFLVCLNLHEIMFVSRKQLHRTFSVMGLVIKFGSLILTINLSHTISS